MMFTRVFLLAPACVALSFAQESPPPSSPAPATDLQQRMAQEAQPPSLPPPAPDPSVPVVKPSVIKLDETRFQIGQVIIDRKTREIRIPAKTEVVNGLIEYPVVYGRGNIHEALAITNINPTDLNLAFKLLRYQQSLEQFSPLDDTGHPTGIQPDIPATTKVAARLGIHLEWTENGTPKKIPLSDCFQATGTNKRMPPGPWLHTEKDFGGNMIALRLDRYATINDLGPDNDESGSWQVIPNILPPTGTNLTIIISPCTEALILQETNTPTVPK
jgi:hypothetical protein